MSVLDSFVTDLNKVIDNREVATTVTAAAVLGLFGVLYRLLDRYLVHRRTVTVTPVFDQAVNLDKKDLTITVSDGSRVEADEPQEQHSVESFVILRFANTGTEKIPLKSAEGDRFTITFPGRTIRVLKVRPPEELVGEPGRPLDPGRFIYFHDRITATTAGLRAPDGRMRQTSALTVPDDVVLYRREAFQLAVFLSGTAREAGRDKVVVTGELARGRITHRHSARWGRLWPAALPSILAAALAVSFGVGALTAHRALTPRAACVGDLPMTIEGSTAFAHVAAEAADDYEQLCPAARITVSAIGSDAAIQSSLSGLDDATVLMVDESGQQVPPGWRPTPVGMVIFGVVANTAYPNAVAGTPYDLHDGGYSTNELEKLYGAASAGGVPFVAVGRSSGSGSAAAFDKMTGLQPATLLDAVACPDISATSTAPGTAAAPGLCDVGTTQKMLDFVDDNSDAIGFAEIDALPQYPYVMTLPVDGAAPNRADVLAGSYPFAVPEYLYTAQTESPQVSAFLAFLQSPAETAQLESQDAGFIPCSGLSGAVADDCALP